jgi:hypothetical protein
MGYRLLLYKWAMKKVLKKKNLMHNFMDDIIQIICKMIQCSKYFFCTFISCFCV